MSDINIGLTIIFEVMAQRDINGNGKAEFKDCVFVLYTYKSLCF